MKENPQEVLKNLPAMDSPTIARQLGLEFMSYNDSLSGELAAYTGTVEEARSTFLDMARQLFSGTEIQD